MDEISRLSGEVKRWALVAAIATAPACALLEKIDKLSKTPGLEEARLTESLKKRPASSPREPSSPLLATPAAVDFGQVRVAFDNQQAVAFSNPFDFAVTIIRTTVEGCGFVLADGAGDRHIVAARGLVTVTVVFRPAERRQCSGLLLLEIDSAGGRFTRVPLTGKGV